jgi:hypothetical protein
VIHAEWFLWLGTLVSALSALGMFYEIRRSNNSSRHPSAPPFNPDRFYAYFAVGVIGCLILLISIAASLKENLNL